MSWYTNRIFSLGSFWKLYLRETCAGEDYENLKNFEKKKPSNHSKATILTLVNSSFRFFTLTNFRPSKNANHNHNDYSYDNQRKHCQCNTVDFVESLKVLLLLQVSINSVMILTTGYVSEVIFPIPHIV